MKTALSPFRNFAVTHDELPAFHAAYVLLTILIAALFNIGFFLLLVAIHMSLDMVKYHERTRSRWKALMYTYRENVIDVALLVLCTVSAIYLHHAAMVTLLSGLARAELTLMWAFGMLLPKMELFLHFTTIFTSIQDHLIAISNHHYGAWTKKELMFVGFTIVGVVLLAVVPFIIPMSYAEEGVMLMNQLIPWKI